MLTGLKPSIGTVGDALDNGLAETTIGLYKTECVRAGSPFRTRPIRTLADLEDITSTWVCWYNASRLMHRLGRRPPTEAEAEYYARPRQQPRPAPRRDGLALRIGTGVPVSPLHRQGSPNQSSGTPALRSGRAAVIRCRRAV
jgi:Integrase core domain